MRGKGEGSIYRRSDGRWCAAAYVDGRRRVRYASTREEAVKLLHESLRAAHAGLPLPSTESLGAYLTRWLAYSRSRRLAESTLEDYEQVIRLHLVPRLGRLRVDRLRPSQLQKFYMDELEDGTPAATLRKCSKVLRAALAQALKWEEIPRNVAKLVEPPGHEPTPMQPLSEEESRRLLAAVRGHRLDALFTLALTTGLRQGELLGLRWADVDLAGGTIRVAGTLCRTSDRGFYMGPPKTKSSWRTVLLSVPTLAALARHRVSQAEEGISSLDGFVFVTRAGQPYHAANVLEQLRHQLDEAGLPRIRFHDLRHTCATLLIRRGVHIRVIADLLGHADPAVTMRVYGHVLPDMREAAAVAMRDIFG